MENIKELIMQYASDKSDFAKNWMDSGFPEEHIVLSYGNEEPYGELRDRYSEVMWEIGYLRGIEVSINILKSNLK